MPPASQQASAAEYILEHHCIGNAWESCYVFFDGVISDGLADEFEKILEHEGPNVFLNSPGGDLQEAIEIGRLIRKSGKRTNVGSIDGIKTRTFDNKPDEFPKNGVCESACAYMFVGGEQRSLESGKLGFHRFYSTGRGIDSDEAQIISGILVAYLVEMGVDARLFLAASKEGAEGMYHVSYEEALEYSVVTPTGFGELFLEPYLSGVVAAARRLDAAGPYDAVNQVTFFCKQSIAHVMLTANAGFLEGNEPMSIRLDTSEGLKNISTKFLTVRDVGDLSTLTVQIPADLLTELNMFRKGNTQEFYIDVVYQRVMGGVYGANLKMSGKDNSMVDSAFSLCIR